MSNRERFAMQFAGDRTLCCAEYGAESGLPIMVLHGGNDSRLAGSLLDAAAIQTGVRLICSDRPGFGRSTFQAGRRLIDWPSDLEQLADHLGLCHFGIIGRSSGGPDALACAAALSEWIGRVATVSSVAPPTATNRGLHPMFRAVEG